MENTQDKAAEVLLESVIAEKFGLMFPFPPVIKVIDNYMLELEHDSVILKKEYFKVLSIEDAEREFLTTFASLSN